MFVRTIVDHGLACHHSIHYSPNTKWVTIFEFIGQRGCGKVLVANWPTEAINSLGPNGRRTPIRGCRKRSAVYHGMADFHACWKSIEDQPSNLFFQNCDQLAKLVQIFLCSVDGRGEVSFQAHRDSEDLFAI